MLPPYDETDRSIASIPSRSRLAPTSRRMESRFRLWGTRPVPYERGEIPEDTDVEAALDLLYGATTGCCTGTRRSTIASPCRSSTWRSRVSAREHEPSGVDAHRSPTVESTDRDDASLGVHS